MLPAIDANGDVALPSPRADSAYVPRRRRPLRKRIGERRVCGGYPGAAQRLIVQSRSHCRSRAAATMRRRCPRALFAIRHRPAARERRPRSRAAPRESRRSSTRPWPTPCARRCRSANRAGCRGKQRPHRRSAAPTTGPAPARAPPRATSARAAGFLRYCCSASAKRFCHARRSADRRSSSIRAACAPRGIARTKRMHTARFIGLAPAPRSRARKGRGVA